MQLRERAAERTMFWYRHWKNPMDYENNPRMLQTAKNMYLKWKKVWRRTILGLPLGD